MKRYMMLMVMLLAAALQGCGGSDAALTKLSDPKVGDIYAAELSEFAAYDIGSKKAFGLMKVVEVDAEKVFVITDSSAWDNATSASREMNGSLSDVVWDTTDRIEIQRARLGGLFKDDKIFGVRRDK